MKNIDEIVKMEKGSKQAKAIKEYANSIFEEYKNAIKEENTEKYEALQNALYYAYKLACAGTGRDKITGLFPTKYTEIYRELYEYTKSLYHSEEIKNAQIDILTGFYDIGEMLQTAYEQEDNIINHANEELKNIELNGKLYSIYFEKDNDNNQDKLTMIISCSDKRKVTAILKRSFYHWCYSSSPDHYSTKLDITYNTTLHCSHLDGNYQLSMFSASHNEEKYPDVCSTIRDIYPPQVNSDDEKYHDIPFSLTETEWINVHAWLKDSIIGKNELQFLNQKFKEFANEKTKNNPMVKTSK